MKRLMLFMLVTFWLGTHLGLAQTKKLHWKGAVNSPNPAETHASVQNSNMHWVNSQIRNKMRNLHKDLKSGKINKDQAKVERDKLKAIRKQELEFFRQNGQKEITADQKNQLSQSLN